MNWNGCIHDRQKSLCDARKWTNHCVARTLPWDFSPITNTPITCSKTWKKSSPKTNIIFPFMPRILPGYERLNVLDITHWPRNVHEQYCRWCDSNSRKLKEVKRQHFIACRSIEGSYKMENYLHFRQDFFSYFASFFWQNFNFDCEPCLWTLVVNFSGEP